MNLFFFFCHKPEREIYDWGHSDLFSFIYLRGGLCQKQIHLGDVFLWLCRDPLGLYSLWLRLGQQAGMKGETNCAPSNYIPSSAFSTPTSAGETWIHKATSVQAVARKALTVIWRQPDNNFDQQIHVGSDLAFYTAQIHSINVYFLPLRDGRKGTK